MGGIAVSVKYDDRDAKKYLGGILKRMGDPKPAMKIMGEIGRTSIVRNFEKGGRPDKWKKLSPETLKRKKGSKILVNQGFAGGLMGAVNYKAFKDKVVLSAKKVYAAIHHLGGMAGRGRKVKIPARPYMMIQDEDWEEMKAALNDFIIYAKT
ncbi:MAG: phage virion morphogenesis protein [Deltaproteobacteria bacterium]|nr:phage virion morphogenesis protein [Deltaproteobacteria bacterium]